MASVVLSEVEIQNFLMIKQARLRLSNRGLVLIQGENEDEPAALSNGSGKSSLVESIMWCLYNATARGVTADGVVNRGEGKGCRVTCQVINGAGTYYIRRHRKHRTGKNTLQVWRGDPATGGIDLSKAKDAETQKLVVNILGCSRAVFEAAVYIGQERMPNLPGMTDSQLKEIVEEAAGLDEVKHAYKAALLRQTLAQKALLEARLKRDHLISLRLQLDESIADLTHSYEEWDERRLANIEGLQKENEVAIVAASELKERLATLDEAGVEREMAQLEAALAGCKEQWLIHSKLVKQVQEAKALANGRRILLERAERDAAKAAEHRVTLHQKIGQACGECGKLYEEKDLAAAQAVSDARCAALQTDLDVARAFWEAADADVQLWEMEEAEASAALPDVSIIAARQGELQGTRIQAVRLGEELRKLRSTYKQQQKRIEEHEQESNPHDVSIQQASARRESTAAGLQAQKDVIQASEVRAYLTNTAVEIFGPAGIRGSILTTKTPFLNQRTGYYLSMLTDGQIRAEWTTLTPIATGEVRENFSIQVTSLSSAETFDGLSGGEKRKVRLACALALQDMIATRASKPLQWWMADEIDDSLDAAGLERLMSILEQKAQERGTVLIISHNSLRDWIREVAVVKRSGGQATITGVLCAEGN